MLTGDFNGVQVFQTGTALRHHVRMPRYNEKEKIREHYDRISPFYHSLWGEHLHHGYWIRGNETKERAQLQLVEHLARAADVPRGARILDVGCGFGASSIYLAREYGANATGITISQVQVEMANRAAEQAQANAKFLHMDAEAMNFQEPFDLIWSVESISHYSDVGRFFAAAVRLLKPGGTMAITDWCKKPGLTAREHKKYLEPIEKGMMIEMHTVEHYENLMCDNGLHVVKTEVLNEQCGKTWDLSMDIIKNKEFWKIAASYGAEFVYFLKSFGAARTAFRSGKFVYGLLVAKKPDLAS